ncbi:MAG: ribose-5-phosphate isomerase RpiA [Candidatus Tectomicrobia bacterium]|uniref:Ribose-5-phosphate isomerase A n=1 Tax=Tectimicrobiota bacterium TaxID=2528274 RepID=A0A938B0C1_UNCTE|nr:ribose-5-phosphate isomerase RpiA [Candidatus Tectomicrobia bacterium]
MADLERMKQLACQRAAQEVRDGMVLGLGTGSTVYYFLHELGRMVNEGLRVTGVPTSVRTAQIAKELAIPLTTLEEQPRLDLAVDGADEVDANLNLVKGAGGALLREKVIAASAARFIVVVDHSKPVQQLGARYPLPVEVVPFGYAPAMRALEGLGARVSLRRGTDGQIWVSDNGNYNLDCQFGLIADPLALQKELLTIPAVVDSGLFLNMTDTVIIGEDAGTRILQR